MTGIAFEQPQLAGVVNYAAALSLEVRKDTVSNRYSVSFLFKNGTDDADFASLKVQGGQNYMWLDDMESTLGVSRHR